MAWLVGVVWESKRNQHNIPNINYMFLHKKYSGELGTSVFFEVGWKWEHSLFQSSPDSPDSLDPPDSPGSPDSE